MQLQIQVQFKLRLENAKRRPQFFIMTQSKMCPCLFFLWQSIDKVMSRELLFPLCRPPRKVGYCSCLTFFQIIPAQTHKNSYITCSCSHRYVCSKHVAWFSVHTWCTCRFAVAMNKTLVSGQMLRLTAKARWKSIVSKINKKKSRVSPNMIYTN